MTEYSEMIERKRKQLAKKRAELAKKRSELAKKRAELERKRARVAAIKKLREEQAKKRPTVREKATRRKKPTVKAPGSGTIVKRPLKKGQQPNITAADLKNVKSLPSSKVKRGVPKLAKRGSDRTAMAAGRNIQRAALLKMSKLRGQRSQPKR